MNRSRSAVTALAALAIAGSAILAGTGSILSGTKSVLAASHDLSIVDFAFEPAQLTVLSGEQVTWTNTSGRTHTVTSDEGRELDGNPIQAGATYGHVFKAPGRYPYHCDIHRQMTGTIVVRAAAADTTPRASPQPTSTATPARMGRRAAAARNCWSSRSSARERSV